MQSFNRHLRNQDIGMILSFSAKKNHNDEFSKFKINISSAGVFLSILENILKQYGTVLLLTVLNV